MGSPRLFLTFIVLFIVILVHRYRVACAYTAKWLAEHRFGGRESPAFKQRINVFVWPITATVVTNDDEGRRVRVKLVIGTLFGGYFNNKIRCYKVERLAE